MKLVFTSYAGVPSFTDPQLWLQRIEGYTGILEGLAATHEVISIERINHEGQIAHKGVRYYFIRQKVKTQYFPRRIHRLIRSLKPDAVFINGFIFPLQLLQLQFYIGKKVPILVINQAEKPAGGYRKWLQRQADRTVSAYLFPSAEAGKQWVTKGIIPDPEKIHEVFHGSSIFVPGDKYAAREKLGLPDSPLYLWVGRLNDNKDPLTVLRAFELFVKEQPRVLLYMIYHEDDLLEDVHTFIRENGLMQNVQLVGRVPHQELQDWYRATDFFISASHYEGGGISVCEAMSCGAIPVVTKIEAFVTLTDNGRCGILFTPGDPVSLLTALRRSDETAIEQMSEIVQEQFNNQFSFTAIAGRIHRLLIRLKAAE